MLALVMAVGTVSGTPVAGEQHGSTNRDRIHTVIVD